MATGKAKKKDKLRHAEYYDFQAIQDKLYADSNKGKVFKHLVEIIALPENIDAYGWHTATSRRITGVRRPAQMEKQSQNYQHSLMNSLYAPYSAN